MEIKHEDDGTKGSFYIEQDNHRVGVMTYVWGGPEKIIIDHTEVDPALKGMNAGKQLVAKAVEFAREKGIKILPLCPFAASVIKRNEAYHDIL